MAFHVACPITCKRICYCTLGYPHQLQSSRARARFEEEVARLEALLKDPRLIRVPGRSTVQVTVPKVVPPPAPAVVTVVGDGVGVDGEEMLSAQTKRAAMQRKAAAVSMVAEDYARRFESGDLVETSKDIAGEEQGQSNVNVMCRICFFGEMEGSERASKMLPCNNCGKKYHRSCLKSWSQNRDLFHWSSWTCPSCRICEVCRRTGDPNKFMFCRRCDGAYHCYCQQPPHKNVGSGPYLCPKHTRCHSCGSNVPGNGLSVRWFLGYTCCDACGRLFVKGNYCPVCLKVYRDSESTPMVCCDVCQRWVHCQCDGISDEKYHQFQVDGNLQYKCATCRGECYQVKDLEDAVQELWRRRDKADRDLIASLRAKARLPTQDEIFSISPYSDDEENGPVILKSEFGRSLKFSLKGSVDKSPKKSKEYGKQSSNKKNAKKKGQQTPLISKRESQQGFEGHDDHQASEYSLGDDKNEQHNRSEGQGVFPSPVAGSLGQTEEICSINQPGVLKQKFVDEIMVNNEDRTSRVIQIKSTKPHGSDVGEDTGKQGSKSKTMKGTKLVIHIGARNRNVTNSPRSDASSCQREQDLTTSNGSEDTSQQKMGDKHDRIAKFGDSIGDKYDYPVQVKSSKHGGREGNLIKLGKVRTETSELNAKLVRGNKDVAVEAVPLENPRVILGKRSIEGSTKVAGAVTEVSRGEGVFSRKHPESRLNMYNEGNNDNSSTPSVSHSLPKDSKPSLKLKFKNPSFENQSPWGLPGEDEKSAVKGQRSKRKRPSPFMEKTSSKEDEDGSQFHQDDSMDQIMDARILKKLGKDAIGKRVEVHQSLDNSWHKAIVIDFEGTSTLSVKFDDGRAKTLELGKQGVRFVSQKQKRSRT